MKWFDILVGLVGIAGFFGIDYRGLPPWMRLLGSSLFGLLILLSLAKWLAKFFPKIGKLIWKKVLGVKINDPKPGMSVGPNRALGQSNHWVHISGSSSVKLNNKNVWVFHQPQKDYIPKLQSPRKGINGGQT